MALLRCYATCIEDWRPERAILNDLAADLLQPAEATKIRQIRSVLTAKRSFLGQVISRKLISDDLNLSNSRINIGRTCHNRPYLKNLQSPTRHSKLGGRQSGNKNGRRYLYDFNISHHGSWALAASISYNGATPPHRLAIGVDVVKYEFRKKFQSLDLFFEGLKHQFTQAEWTEIRGVSVPAIDQRDNNPAQTTVQQVQLARLYRRWAVKEAYTKALGIGVAFGFSRIESIDATADTPTPVVSVDGVPLSANWNFQAFPLDARHHVVVCSCVEQGTEAQEKKLFAPVLLDKRSPIDLISQLPHRRQRLCPTSALESLGNNSKSAGC